MIFKDKQEFIERYEKKCVSETGKSFNVCTTRERYDALAKLIISNAQNIKKESHQRRMQEGGKRVYYFSMEFLIGRLMENYLSNLGIRDLVAESLADMGEDLDKLCEQECDPGLGNGGLGRLAACFIDSMASLGIYGNGNGIRYRYGLFRQEIRDGRQVELPDNWLAHGYPWETRRPERTVVVRFGGEVVRHEKDGKFWFTWEGGERIVAVPYDVPVVGDGGTTVNTLRLWSAEPYEENFDMDAFNRGDYSAAVKFRSDVEAITCVLYPNDNSYSGKVLRLKQEYMFVAAGIADIVRTFKDEYASDWKRFPEVVAIQTNDTHPALCAPELLRILIDEEGLDWDTAWDITVRSISYTNHTILPEALEKWPIDMVRGLLPRVYTFIEEIDRRYREKFPRHRENWSEILRNTAILWDGTVRMANLSIIAGHSVNGVAGLHTEILKRDVLKDFYTITPEKFNNKTNGVSHRRFLMDANPALSAVITSAIGDEWKNDISRLEDLLPFENDSAFKEKVRAAKKQNKERLAKYIKETSGVTVDTDSVFDIQVKRFHAYKRQHLNIFKIMDLYNRILDDPNYYVRPSTFIFAGKAAQGYDFAKDVIRLVNSVADVVNNDSRVRDRIKVAFVPNFSVSNAQLIYPAADISEQISTAGLEASGTGNMKFMFNGAITLTTLDGSNVELRDIVGPENVEIFGLRAEEIAEMKRNNSYYAWDEYNNNPALKRVVDELVDGTFDRLSGGFHGVYDNLLRNNDEFFVLKDFESYLESWNKLEKLYGDKEEWTRISVHNTAKAAFFSSDRSIKEYATDIWNI